MLEPLKKHLLLLSLSLCVLLPAECGKGGIEGTWKPDTSGLGGEKKKEAEMGSMVFNGTGTGPFGQEGGYPISFHMEDRR